MMKAGDVYAGIGEGVLPFTMRSRCTSRADRQARVPAASSQGCAGGEVQATRCAGV